MESRVVISGIGILSGMGNNMDDIWEAINYNNDASIRIEVPDLYKTNVKRRMDSFSYMSLVAATKALQNSHIEKENYDFEKVGTVFNSGYGPIESNFSFARKLVSSGPELVSPIVFAGTVSNSNIGHVCMNLGLKGPSTSFMGSNAIGYSYDLLKNGISDAIITGGMEQYDETIMNVYSKMDYVEETMDVKYLVKPYDVNSKGITLAEGATLLVLEKEQTALERGDDTDTLVEVVGYAGALSAELPERYLAKMDASPYFMSMQEALKTTGIAAEKIDFIYSSATGAKEGDLAELRAINQLFGASVPITTQVGKFGLVYGANSATSVALAAMMLQKNEILPICGLDEADPQAEGNLVRKSIKGNFTYALINSIEMGGNIISIIIKKYQR